MTIAILDAVAAYYIYSDSLALWDDTKHHGAGAFSFDAVFGYVGADVYSPNFDRNRMFLKFDTSSIPVGATITSVKLRLNIWAAVSVVSANFDTLIIKQDWSAQDPIVDGASADAAYDNCYDGTPDTNIFENSANLLDDLFHNSGELDTAWVNKGGDTYYSLIADFDKNNVEPVATNYIVPNGIWETNTAKLVIEYIVPETYTIRDADSENPCLQCNTSVPTAEGFIRGLQALIACASGANPCNCVLVPVEMAEGFFAHRMRCE